MATTLVPLQEYLETDYSPDREYVDGELVERHVGKRRHSRVQTNFVYFLQKRHPKLFVWVEQRVRTGGTRIRIPDICVTLDDPEVDVFSEPPFLSIEVLSPDDEMTRVLEKLEEYSEMGVAHIWVADPRRLKAFTYSGKRLEEVIGELRAGEVVLPLTEVFARL